MDLHNSIKNSGNLFTIEDIKGDKHNRVMTKDRYRIRNDLDKAYKEEIDLIEKYFSLFFAYDYPEEWKQKIIKYIYRKLVNSIRNDRGLGVSSHFFEEKPARTMLVEESLIADKVLENVLLSKESNPSESYCNAFKASNISSSSWEYVGCVVNDEAFLKLKIVKECLFDKTVDSRKNMILYRYIGGLRKIAQYNIFKLMNYDDEECMEIVKILPF